MGRLVTVPVSRAEAAQRAGRAGRTAPGVCYRLYSRHAFEGMAAFAPPEIHRADLAPLALELALWGARDAGGAAVARPAAAGAARDCARALLADLGALDAAGAADAARPGDGAPAAAPAPRAPGAARGRARGRGASAASWRRCSPGGTSWRGGPARRAAQVAGACDLEDRVEALDRFRRTGRADAGTDAAALRAAARAAEQLERLLPRRRRGAASGANRRIPRDLLGRLLLDAWPDRLARLRERRRRPLPARERPRGAALAGELRARSRADRRGRGRRRRGGGGGHPRGLGGGRGDGPRGVRGAHRRRARRGVGRAAETGRRRRARADRRRRAGRAAVHPGDGEALPLLCEVIRARGAALLPLGERGAPAAGAGAPAGAPASRRGVAGPLRRARSSSRRRRGSPRFSRGVRSERDLQRVDLAAALRSLVPPRLLPQLDRLAPTHLAVPSGRRAALDYAPPEGPVLAVKLQELFGLGETPAVAGGRAPVLLHLLSPAGRPVQVTRDLRGLLGRRLPAGARRAARALPAAPLAGRPLERPPDPQDEPRRPYGCRR